MKYLTSRQQPPRLALVFVVAAFLVAGFAGVWYFGSKAAQNPAADLNNDAQVNVFDLSILLSNWAKTIPSTKGDINTDNVVNVFDLSIMLASWGPVTAAPTSTPSLTPTPATSCALPIYPNAACTGVPAGTTLQNVPAQRTSGTGWQWVVDGDYHHIRVTGNNAIVENVNITGCVAINANVTGAIIRKAKITCSQGGVANDGTNTLIEDVEIDCMNKGGATAIGWQGYTARRVHAYHCDNTMWAEHNVLIEDSYIHDNIPYDPVTDPHTDGIQMPGGSTNITIRHNTVYGGYLSQANFGNSAITGGGVMTNILIQDNLLAGGGYTLYCTGPGASSNERVINNHFSRIYVSTVGGFGPTTDCADEAQFTGNVYHETGLPVTP